MAEDLTKKYEVSVADINDKALDKLKQKHSEIKTMAVDLSQPEKLKKTIKDYDLVVSAVPGFMGFYTLKTILQFTISST